MKSRRFFLKQGALASAAMLLPAPIISFTRNGSFFQSEENSITLLHTNDLHNQIDPISTDKYKNMGGFEKTAGIISNIKNNNRQVVLLDAGDIFCGNIHHQKEHAVTLKMMQSAGYDAALPGNRDYEAGPDYFKEQWQGNKVSLVASNYACQDSRLNDMHQRYKIVQKGRIKIGVIGAGINLKALVPAGVSNLVQYTDPVNELSAIATMLKQDKKCQLVVCLSHLGYKNSHAMDDLKLAGLSSNIDVIIGGHSHTLMQAPQIVLNKQQQEVIINHAGYGGLVLGSMHIGFDDYGNKSQVTFNNLLVGAKDNRWFNNPSFSLDKS